MTRALSYREALRAALRGALAEDDRVVVLGQDVGARGGSYGVTAGLLEDFGAGRVLDAPSSEAAIVGVGIGAAMAGLRPVVELTTATFAGLAYDQLAHHAAPLRTLSGGRVTAPLVLRMPQSTGSRLGPVHGGTVEALLHWLPGLTVWTPSTPGDAFGMLRAALRGDDPVVLLEHTLLYDVVEEVDDEASPETRFGAVERRSGPDLTLVAGGRMVGLALDAATRLDAEGIAATVVDLRALRPLDAATVSALASRTGRAVLIEEGPPHGGPTATLAALLPRDVDLIRVTGADTHPPYAARLEAAALPSVERILAAARTLLATPTGRPDQHAAAPTAPPAEPPTTTAGVAPSAPPFTATAPVDVEALLATRRATARSLAAVLADAVADLLPNAIVTAGTDTTVLGHLSPGVAPATLSLGAVTTRPTVLDGAVTIRHTTPLTLTTTTHATPDADALFSAIRARLAGD